MSIVPKGIIALSYSCVLALLVGVTSGYALAQRGRGGHPTSNLTELEGELREQYNSMDFGMASETFRTLSSAYTRARRELPAELVHLGEQIDRATRLMPKVEPLQLLHREVLAIEMLPERFSALRGAEVHDIRFRIADGRLMAIEYMSPLGDRGLLAERSPRGDSDVVQIVASSTGDILEDMPLPPSVNTEEDEAYPVLMPDGMTLVFGRHTSEGLGGYDLLMSRYHVGREVWLEATPLGLPFNSPANDYLLLYDDTDDTTILLSDRGCDAGQIALFKFMGMPRVLARLVESSAERELSPQEMLQYVRLEQPLVESPRRATEPQAEHSSYYRLYGIEQIRTAEGRRVELEARRVHEELTRATERQARLRYSYRQSEMAQSELTPELTTLETEIETLERRYATLVGELRTLEQAP